MPTSKRWHLLRWEKFGGQEERLGGRVLKLCFEIKCVLAAQAPLGAGEWEPASPFLPFHSRIIPRPDKQQALSLPVNLPQAPLGDLGLNHVAFTAHSVIACLQ